METRHGRGKEAVQSLNHSTDKREQDSNTTCSMYFNCLVKFLQPTISKVYTYVSAKCWLLWSPLGQLVFWICYHQISDVILPEWP